MVAAFRFYSALPSSHFAKLLCVGLLLLMAGCKEYPSLRPTPTTTVSLTIEATPLQQGEVAITGTTNLPDNTPLVAAAIRYLEPENLVNGATEPTYSVLAYQSTTVEQGAWSAQLDLWQVADDGHYQEAWQPQLQELRLAAIPGETVQFVVMVSPHQFPKVITETFLNQATRLSNSLVRTTAEGDSFLLAAQSQPVALPTGQTTPPADLARRHNGGWGKRYLLVEEPPLPYTLSPEDERKTNAPPRPEEFLY